jgi:uncharacterized membrane protein YgcG
MSAIDDELATLHARIAKLEEAKKMIPPPKTLEIIRDEITAVLKNNRYSKSVPLAAFYDRQRVETLDAILAALTTINARLDALEAK